MQQATSAPHACPKMAGVISSIEAQRAIIADASTTASYRFDRIKFIVRLVQDLADEFPDQPNSNGTGPAMRMHMCADIITEAAAAAQEQLAQVDQACASIYRALAGDAGHA